MAEFGIFKLFNSNEDNENDVITDFNVESFLENMCNGTITLLTQSNYKELRRPLLVIFHHFKLSGTKRWIDELYEIALEFPNSIQFAVGNIEDVALLHIECDQLDYFGFDVDIAPHVFAIDADDRIYDFKEPFTVDNLRDYCKLLKSNKLYRSDPIPPADDSDQSVQTIVGDSFRKVFEENHRDVLLTIHSNYTFKHESTLWGVPDLFNKDRDILVFYKINAQTNYVPPEFRVSEYPTTFFIRCNDKGKRFRHVHTYFDYFPFKEFIAKNTSKDLRTLDRSGYSKSQNMKETDPIENENLADNEQTKILSILEKLSCVVERTESNETNDDSGFFKFLSKILSKVDETERDSIKVELITLASNRVREVLETKMNS